MRAGSSPRPIRISHVLAFWAVLALLLIVRTLVSADTRPLFGDGDDAMRMVTATDLMSGQNWQDTIEWRDNTPFGSSMHWSRLIDAPIAGLQLLARAVFGSELAPTIAAMVWPLLLLLPLLWLSLLLARRFVPGSDLPGLALPAVSMVLLIEFLPGRVDHHNIQILLTTGLLLTLLESRHSQWAAICAGVLAGTSIAIGLETLPFVMCAVFVVSLFWVFDRQSPEKNTKGFALAFGGSTVGHFLLAIPPSMYLTPACDALSITYVVAAVSASLAIMLAVYLGRTLNSAPLRLALIGGLGLAAIVVTAWFSPACLRGPYANLDADTYSVLFPTIAEAQPAFTRLFEDPAAAIAFALTPIIALAVTLRLCWKSDQPARVDWLVLLLFLAVAVGIMMLQIRGARLAAIFAIPAASAVILMARRRYLSAPDAAGGLGLAGSWLAFSGVFHYAAVAAIGGLFISGSSQSAMSTQVNARDVCFHQATYSALATLPAGRIVAPLRIGPHILAFTPHSVVSTGFHRNAAGTSDVLTFFSGDESSARNIARDRALDYVVVCDGMSEVARGGAPGDSSFISLREAGRHWSWLVPVVQASGNLTVFRIDQSR